ncbi:hypothetical protein Bhyg_04269 [Pseudolycoriella hygida]|uniref:Uncharacterized protein n=1 Tax=Pseudolycoriella hygida TaxID=35572 RepID=A0A9Q0NEY7_9DIPT|nr:hypothetical protein Bhyg_12043 [Pseudolycoriella hygida]KAJ6649037.1 hypothetical protein Bhyg_04269 [Pseudolycoriella hygida]
MASDLPETILKKSETAVKALGPEKSSKRYDETYNRFIDWRKQQGTESFVEEVFLAYFEDKSQHYAPSTLWSIYSMLKSKMIANNIDISRYSRLLTFKSKSFCWRHRTPEFLVIKAVTVFGISVGCRGEEICNVMLGHVKDTGSEIVVRIPESKTYTAKLFPILSKTSVEIIRRYIALRPPNSPTDRFFILQRGNRCFGQPIGKNTIAQMPRKVAAFLNYCELKNYLIF